VSKKQTIKMKSAILSQSNADMTVLQNLEETLWIRHVSSNIRSRILSEGERSKTLPDMIGNSKKRSPAFIIPEDDREPSIYLRSTKRNDVQVAKWIDYFASDEQTNKLWGKSQEFVSSRLMGKGRPVPKMTYPDVKFKDLQAGTLSVIQEGGAKARWVANPLLAFQAIGEPLKDKLWAYTKLAYADVICTDDQERGISTVTKWLSQDRRVWSFDASAFTDRFPLSLQLVVLDKLVGKGIIQDIDVEWFKLVVSKSWICRAIRSDVTWSVGQPLGYGPSFHVATLTHAALVETLCTKLGIMDRPFQIVGDDIVISNEQLALSYSETMSSIGVEINLSKSLISNEYAEFVGKLVSSEGANPSMKTKILISHSQIVDTLRFYGMNGLKWLTPWERSQALRVYLPVDLGGYDWRPAEISWKSWLAMTQQEYFAVKRLEKDFVAFYGRETLIGALDVELALQRRFEFYSINGYGISNSEWLQIGVKEELNRLTDFPIAKTRDDSRSAPSTNTFRYIEDTIVRLNQYHKDKGIKPSLLLLQNSRVSVSAHGYLNNTEKPYTGQSVIQVIKDEREYSSKEKPSSPVRYRDIYKSRNLSKGCKNTERYEELKAKAEKRQGEENFGYNGN